MLLSEKELSGILDDHLSVANSTGHAWVSVKSIDAAAHAIAKKLAEGVVWSGPAEARRLHGPENREQMYLHYPHIDRPGHTECFTEGWPLEHGQRVTVTVTKEEGGGQEDTHRPNLD